MKHVELKEILWTYDSLALTAIIDYWKDYEFETVLLAYAELKRRKFILNKRLLNKLNQFCIKNDNSDIEILLNELLSDHQCNSFIEFISINDKKTKERINQGESVENILNEHVQQSPLSELNDSKIEPNINMKNWRDYIDQKFVPREEYEFDYKSREHPEWTYYIIIITHKQTNTWFEFQNAYGTWEVLTYVKYGNPNTKCCPHTGDIGDFDEYGLQDMTNFLRPAFEGWSSKDYYLFNKCYKSSFFGNPNFQGKGYWYYEKFGCFDLITLPLQLIVDALVRMRIIGYLDEVVIKPINPSKS